MTYTQERASVNQIVQIGAESLSALGTPVSAGKLLQCYSWTIGIEADVVFYTATGHKYAAVSEENMEWSGGSISGIMDYNGLIYPLQGAMGNVSPASHVTNTVTSATAKDWVLAPPITGSIETQTYTVQQGDSTRSHQIAYVLFTDFGYKGTRKEFTVDGKFISQKLSDGITKTSSPVAVPLAPVVANQVNVYLDSSQANFGTTQLLRFLSIEFSMGNIYAPLWVVNRSNASFVSHVDTLPKTGGKIKMEADVNGMTPLSYLQSGATYYLQVDAQGAVIDNLQQVSLGSPSAGTLPLTYKGQTTSGIAYNAAASAVQSALTGLSTVGAGNATVSGSAGGPYAVNFIGTLAQDTTAMTGSGSGLTGGTFAITQAQTVNEVKHQMAIKFGKPSPFSDDSGVFAIEWEYEVVEDSTWGHSQILTVTNLLTAL